MHQPWKARRRTPSRGRRHRLDCGQYSITGTVARSGKPSEVSPHSARATPTASGAFVFSDPKESKEGGSRPENRHAGGPSVASLGPNNSLDRARRAGWHNGSHRAEPGPIAEATLADGRPVWGRDSLAPPVCRCARERRQWMPSLRCSTAHRSKNAFCLLTPSESGARFIREVSQHLAALIRPPNGLTLDLAVGYSDDEGFRVIGL